MNHWSEYPFVRILFAFLAGILSCLFTPLHLPPLLLLLLVLLNIMIHFFSANKTVRLYKHAAIIGCCLQLTAFVFGNLLTANRIDENDPKQFVHSIATAAHFVVKITEPPIEKEKSYKLFVSAMAVCDSGRVTSTFGKSILYVSKDSSSAKLKYGDVLRVKNTFQQVAAPANPDQFDYKKYLWYREIYATAFLKNEEWNILPLQSVNPLFQFTFRLRELSVNAIQASIPSVREAAVVEALVIGYRDDMSMETMQSYTAAGVVHVLAVSGLHVAIVFALLHQLLFFLNRKKHGKLLQSVIILLAIWIFTLVTGLSGSVVRASAMFTFITVGKNMKRPVNMFNILACSATVILLIDPLLLMDVGFQLSYLAVFGIGTLNKYIDQWLPRENKIVDYLWKMVAMSLAAQIATLPLTTYYFHQFPTYFLLANIVVIPAAGILLHLGIALIAVQFFSPVATFMGKIIEWITYAMNEFIERIQQLPAATLYLPEISLVQLILLGTFIIFCSIFFTSARKEWLFAGVISLLGLTTIHCIHSYFLIKEKNITLYAFKGINVLEFRSGNTVQIFQSGENLSRSDSIYLRQHWRLNNTMPVKLPEKMPNLAAYVDQHFAMGCSLFQFYDYKMAVIREPLLPTINGKQLKVDGLIISGNPSVTINELLQCFETGIIIFDPTNSRYHISKWQEEARQLGVATHDAMSEGAFVKKL